MNVWPESFIDLDGLFILNTSRIGNIHLDTLLAASTEPLPD